MLYDLVVCEHRPWMDLFADRALRDDFSPFLNLLWRRGRAHEEEAIAGIEVLNLRVTPLAEREAATVDAMRRGVPIIYGGRISAGDLLGEPDLLRLGNGGYVPGDIKSGAGEEGSSDETKRPKKHYAVQLALYVDILERLEFSDGRKRAFVWDIHGDEIAYDLTVPKGKRTPESLWDDYQECIVTARQIIAGIRNPGPSYQGECKNCVWFGACLADLEAKDDLTLIPGLGRSKRTPLLKYAANTAEFAALEPARLLDEKGKSIVPGLGTDSISKFHARAVLNATRGSPYIRTPVEMPNASIELFFDIETDPMRDHCYLHGFVERRNQDDLTERYESFFSAEPTPESEREAFAAAWEYVLSRRPCVIYVYSKYERTWWRALQAKYPDVCSSADIEAMFADDAVVDLFSVVQSSTEWPTRDHSIKTLATYLGFEWRDPRPSGAASIEWYDRHTSGDETAKPRILEYNEDDCRAMRVLLDAIRRLPVAG
jgi:uncharacterized protein